MVPSYLLFTCYFLSLLIFFLIPFASYFLSLLIFFLFPFASYFLSFFPHSLSLLCPLSLFLPFLSIAFFSISFLFCFSLCFIRSPSFVIFPAPLPASAPPYLPFGLTISHWLPFIYFPFISIPPSYTYSFYVILIFPMINRTHQYGKKRFK